MQMKLDGFEGEESVTKYAKWQRAYRKRQRERGYELVSHYVPSQYADTVRKLLKLITPKPDTKRGNTLLFLMKVLELADLSSAVLVYKDINGWHVEDWGNIPVGTKKN